MRFDVVTLFPDMVNDAARYGVTGKAIDNGIVEMNLWNPRDYAKDKYRSVDDRPYGGGPGMVMMVPPLCDAVRAAKAGSEFAGKTIFLSPQGSRLTQNDIKRFSSSSQLILIAGRYEGIDERFIQMEVDEEWSLGDYVLSGGELAALILVDAVTRLLPGVLGDDESAQRDSYMNGLLDYPHYTRPVEVEGLRVPDVLLSGNHEKIDQWRMKQALYRTKMRRPDLLAENTLTKEQRLLIEECEFETGKRTENE